MLYRPADSCGPPMSVTTTTVGGVHAGPDEKCVVAGLDEKFEVAGLDEKFEVAGLDEKLRLLVWTKS